MSKKFKMPKQFGEKWVKALRSGDYKQTDGVLYCEDFGYCCLGVACAMVGIPDNIMRSNGLIIDIVGSSGIKEEIKLIPDILKENKTGYSLVNILTELNDHGISKAFKRDMEEEGYKFPTDKTDNSYSFNEIADFIEANVEFT